MEDVEIFLKEMKLNKKKIEQPTKESFFILFSVIFQLN